MMENDDSGFILCYKMKRKYPDVPIIIATAVTAETGMSFDVTGDDERRWIKADLFLDKGIRADQLLREINRLLKI
jgi:CheY-like chemotaxis protein